jgi:hypothetical protein
MTPQAFVAKWRAISATEKKAYQEHFIDLCRLVGHPTPLEEDPTGTTFAFEVGANKQGGGAGWADVWKRGCFAIEYKGPDGDLDRAYRQLLQYRESLENPPLLVVSDLHTIAIHTNFTNTVKRIIRLDLDDLLTPAGLQTLRALFYEPEAFRSEQTTAQVTEEAARHFARLARHLGKWGHDSHRIAHFSIRLLFCLFAEDIGLLPKDVFTRLVAVGRRRPGFGTQLRQLFAAMATGGFFGEHEIRCFDGGLFNDADVLDMDGEALDILHQVAGLDWSALEPSIFGTLFTRSLDPAQRAQLGAQYTSAADILLIVEPVVMAPLRREWAAVQARVRELLAQRAASQDRRTQAKLHGEIEQHVTGFARRLAATRVLDPACGSGNFLYVALRLLLDLWKEVALFAGAAGLPLPAPLPGLAPSPEQLYGIELNDYAHELAQATVWIGYLQWLHQHGFGVPGEPVLKRLDNIRNMDAILAYDGEGRPMEPEWPAADVIVGNPPFLGGNKIRQELGDRYVDALFALYAGRVPAFADLVCYWFEKARFMIEQHRLNRAGFLATQAIRGGVNRVVLDRIKTTGNIFFAYSDRDWVLDGATVHVSMVAFDDGTELERSLNGSTVAAINPDLTSAVDVTIARTLPENAGIAFIGDTKKGKFDISADVAREMLTAPSNPNGRPNSDVIRPWINGLDITGRPRNMWIVDFGNDMPMPDAAQYELPFEHVRRHVKPERDNVRNPRERRYWWIHGRAAPDLRDAISGLDRYVATPRVAKHRLFVFVGSETLPDGQVVIFARSDDYFLGVLQSHAHEVWARMTGTQLREAESGFRYSQTMTFETFPFPWPPGQEPQDDPQVRAIAQAARELVEKRAAWLDPPGLGAAELKQRTLTRLYNQRPTWLELAHRRLDAAVCDAYGWPDALGDEEILARLLALNLEREK